LASSRSSHPLPPFQYVILLKKGKNIYTKGGLGQNPQKKNKFIQEKQGTEIANEINK